MKFQTILLKTTISALAFSLFFIACKKNPSTIPDSLVSQPQQSEVSSKLQEYFNEAYTQYPNIPRGILEATAYTASHFRNLDPDTSESSNYLKRPPATGLFGLIEDGKEYFKNNLNAVVELSSLTVAQFKKDERLQILAVAKYLSRLAAAQGITPASRPEDMARVLENFSEIPADNSSLNTYARKLYTYDIYSNLKEGFATTSLRQRPVNIQMNKIYGEEQLRLLKAPQILLDTRNENVRALSQNSTLNQDYPIAIWNPAPLCNFSISRKGVAITHIVIHTAQGSYAGTISWFKNCKSKVSAHYVVRSSDGQITQMVHDRDKAWHAAVNNSYTIGVMHEGYIDDGSWYTDNMYSSSADLVRYLCERWGIDPTTCYSGPGVSGHVPISNEYHIKGYQQYASPARSTPGPYWNWKKFAWLINR